MSYYFKKVGITSDHAGKDLKFMLIDFIKLLEVEVVDYGVSVETDKAVDYPDYAALVAEDVSRGKLDGGIAICGTGIGMAIVANKFSNVRAGCVWDEFSCRMSRAHNDSNVLCLGGRTINYHRAADYVKIWLSTPFAGEQHKIRIEKIANLEKKFR